MELRRVDDRGRILLSRADLEHLGVKPGEYVALDDYGGYPGHGHVRVYAARVGVSHA